MIGCEHQSTEIERMGFDWELGEAHEKTRFLINGSLHKLVALDEK